MTEDDAKRKRCCGPFPCGEVPMGSADDQRYCIGSACMAWRFATMAKDSGYCGHAGKP